MHAVILALIVLDTVAAMELFAYAAHRWIMHGPGWFLHASHHRVRTGAFELNDLYGVIFAVPSVVLTPVFMTISTSVAADGTSMALT